MALKVGELVAFLRLDKDDFDKKLDGAKSKFDAAGDKVGKAGKELTTKVTLPLAGAGLAILKSAGDFESSMNQVRAATGATGDEMAAMEGLAKDLGATTAFSASEAADAMYFLSSAGFDVSDVMSTLPGVLDLAAAGSMDLASAADIASNILSGYGMEADQLGRVNDALVKTFQSSNVNVQMVGESMKYVAPIAASAGLQFEEVTAAIGMLGNAGIQGSQAGTVLRSAITSLLNPTGAAADVIEDLGLVTHDSNGDLLSLDQILTQLEDSGATTADMIQLFGQEAGPGMQALLAQGADALGDLTGELENSGGTAAEVADIQMEGLNGSLAEMRSALERLALAIADSGLLEWATNLTGRLTGLVQQLSATDNEMLRGATIAGMVLMALGPVLIVVGKLIKIFGSAFVTLIRFVRGLAMMVKGLILGTKWLAIKTAAAVKYAAMFAAAAARVVAAATRMAISMAATAARVVAGWVLMGLQAMLQAARMALAWIIAMGPIGWIIAAVIALVILIIANWDTIKEWTLKIFSWVVDFIKKAVSWIIDLFMKYSPVGIVISNWDKIKDAVRAGLDWVRNRIRTILNFVMDLFRKYHPIMIVRRNWDTIKKLFGNALNWIRNQVSNRLNAIIGFFRKLPGKLKSGLSKLRSMLLSPFKSAFNAIIGLWNRSIGAISFDVPSWVPGVGGKGFSFPTIPMLAEGGRALRSGLALVGEEGPELLHMPRGAAVEPLDRTSGRQNVNVRGVFTLKGDGLLSGFRREIRWQGGNVEAVI